MRSGLWIPSFPKNLTLKLSIYKRPGDGKKKKNVELARGEQALVSLWLIERPTLNFEKDHHSTFIFKRSSLKLPYSSTFTRRFGAGCDIWTL